MAGLPDQVSLVGGQIAAFTIQRPDVGPRIGCGINRLHQFRRGVFCDTLGATKRTVTNVSHFGCFGLRYGLAIRQNCRIGFTPTDNHVRQLRSHHSALPFVQVPTPQIGRHDKADSVEAFVKPGALWLASRS